MLEENADATEAMQRANAITGPHDRFDAMTPPRKRLSEADASATQLPESTITTAAALSVAHELPCGRAKNRNMVSPALLAN